MARIWMPLPDRDFDLTESAVPWKVLTDAGHEVVFATENGGTAPSGDRTLLKSVVFGKLGAEEVPKQLYLEMEETAAFKNPTRWADFAPPEFDGVILCGGHAPGMKQYLASDVLQQKLVEFWRMDRPVGAICHGTVVLARAIDPQTQKSVLAGRKTTCLPKYMERLSYWMTFWKLGRHYRTYPTYVQDEVKSVLDDANAQFVRGPVNLGKHATAEDDTLAFVVEDGNYVSARWPGDAFLFSQRFLALVEAAHAQGARKAAG